MVGRQPLVTADPEQIAAALATTPGGRVVQAMFDLDANVSRRTVNDTFSSADAQALYASRDRLQNETNLLRAQLEDALSNFEKVEADRVARGNVIESQGKRLSELEASMHETLGRLKEAYESAESVRNERNLLLAQLADLRRNFDAVEADRAARGDVIASQGARVAELQKLVHERLVEAEAGQKALAALQVERKRIDDLLTRHSSSSTMHSLKPPGTTGSASRSSGLTAVGEASDRAADAATASVSVEPSETKEVGIPDGRSIDELAEEIRLLQRRRDQLTQIEEHWLFRLGKFLRIL
jgi:hypothetical protein